MVTSDTRGSCRRIPSGRWVGVAGQDGAGKGLYGWMVGNVAVYLLPGLVAQGIIVAGHEAVFIHKGDVPKVHEE